MNQSKTIQQMDMESLWHPITQHSAYLSNPPKVIERAEGCYIYDSEGNKYLEGVSGLWCVNVGYGRKALAETAKVAMEQYTFLPMTFSHAPAAKLASKLLDILNMEGKVYFTSSGSEANEAAFKIARQYHAQVGGNGSRHKIITRYRSYHGNTMGAISATGQADRKVRYEPLVPGFVHVEPPDPYRTPFHTDGQTSGEASAKAIEDAILREGVESVAAVIMEPIISGGGIFVPSDDYLPMVREICDKYGVLLILDEVVSGFGRTGKMFGKDHWGIQPDIITLAKGIGSGYVPLGALAASQNVFEAFLNSDDAMSHFRHINTYGGHPMATAVGLKNIEIMEDEGLVENAAKMGAYMLDQLKQIDNPLIGEVRGKGLLIGIELVSDPKTKAPLDEAKGVALAKHCLENGVIIGRNALTTPGHANVMIMAPPLIITKVEADLILTAFKNALVHISG